MMKPGFNWLSELSPMAASAVTDAAQTRTLAPATMLYQQGDHTREFFQIVSGEVRQFLLNEDGREVLLYINRAGDVVADSSALDGEPYPVFIETRGETVLRVWSVDTLARLRAAFPEIDAALARQMSKRMRAFLMLIEELCTLPMPARVAGRILALAEASGQTRLQVSQADLAMMSGVTRASVNEIVAALRARGLIATQYGRVTILDRPGLVAFRASHRRATSR
ncbi:MULTISPECIES: Crp/Fnr family transcriptional regulator [unclassified Sphingomonas]|jgi:CRP-like cAMP-binding protein|uniref:Crp/Fnr family transcriptional regulator n=1 Tax=unclassified Sphingomonas TaxID=196159 RepID=UPI00082B1630|nr:MULTISPECIES: Crp/Fnr family transcriptional regulator [unclassified Sphingomonas]